MKTCSLCGKEIFHDEFRDMSSLKEFKLSGMCQDCQDDFFEVRDEN